MMKLPMLNDHFGFKYGDRDFEGRLHPGDDYNGAGAGAADKGTPLIAIAPAEITFLSFGVNQGWGNHLYYKVDMKQFFIGYGVPHPEWCPDFVWIHYAHCENINVAEGQKVEAGTVIARLGGTPKWSPHLHWEVRKRPLGVNFYPNASYTQEMLDERYFNPTQFVAAVNEWLTTHMSSGFTPKSDLIKSNRSPKVYFYNGVKRFWIPDFDSLLLIFGEDAADRIETIDSKYMKGIEEGEEFPSVRP